MLSFILAPIGTLLMNRLHLYIFVLFFPSSILAQGGAGVFPPMVEQGHKSLEYRAAVDPATRADEIGFLHRIHYQQSINSDFMWRVIGQTRKTNNTYFDFDFIQTELFWDLSEDNQKYRTGLRFDARLRDNNRPNQLGLNWTNQYNFDDNWYARALLMTSVQVGNNSVDGVTLQTRWQLAKRLRQGQTVGLELYNNYGNERDSASFDEQNHSIGPIYVRSLGTGWSIFSSALFGLSDRAADTELKVWITKSM